MASKLDVTGDLLLRMVTTEWAELAPIVEELVPTVAPGMAMRRFNSRERSRVERGDLQKPKVLSDNDKQASGARSIISDRIQAQKKSGRVEVEVRDGVRYIRRVHEACPTCLRPFPTATRKPQAASQAKSRQQTTVVYPYFPQWAAESQRKTAQAGGSSE